MPGTLAKRGARDRSDLLTVMLPSQPSPRELRAVDTSTLWHPFTQMRAYGDEGAPIIESATGVWLQDTEGRRYYDGISSLWCNVHGHRHPTIDAAIRAQLEKVAHTTLLGLGSVPSIQLADRLATMTGIPHVFYSDAGATAVEIALKAAFQYMRRTRGPSRRSFLALRNSYHGDTIGSVSLGGIDVFHEVFRPLLFPVHFAPSPYAYRWPGPDCGGECLQALEALLAEHRNELCAIVMEPRVQGAAGILVQPPGFVRAVRDLATKHGVLFIADEVATGFGRTGTMFACEAEGVVPDILCVGKGLSGGYLPLAATLFSDEIYADFLGDHAEMRHFLHGHTFTGNALACAAALGSLDVFREERVIENLPARIRAITDGLSPLAAHPRVGEIRQCGMMVGIELVADRGTREPYSASRRTGHQVILAARRRGMILRPLGDVVVLMPPLSSTIEDIRAMTAIVNESIGEALG